MPHSVSLSTWTTSLYDYATVQPALLLFGLNTILLIPTLGIFEAGLYVEDNCMLKVLMLGRVTAAGLAGIQSPEKYTVPRMFQKPEMVINLIARTSAIRARMKMSPKFT